MTITGALGDVIVIIALAVYLLAREGRIRGQLVTTCAPGTLTRFHLVAAGIGGGVIATEVAVGAAAVAVAEVVTEAIAAVGVIVGVGVEALPTSAAQKAVVVTLALVTIVFCVIGLLKFMGWKRRTKPLMVLLKSK